MSPLQLSTFDKTRGLQSVVAWRRRDDVSSEATNLSGHQSLSNLVGESPNIPCDVLMKYLRAAGFRVIYSPV